ncbi:MAG: helix-turn-helix transcriptional regulator [Syntrophaceae bacterium]|nr:helix-turn-helix transcriptional regulator [Syntrophaceae bacterium]
MTRDDLKKWRRQNDYSQAKLAKALGVSVITVCRWETGTRSIPVFLNLALKGLEVETKEASRRKKIK